MTKLLIFFAERGVGNHVPHLGGPGSSKAAGNTGSADLLASQEPIVMLGGTSFGLLWVWFFGAFVLGAGLMYAVMKAGTLRRGERQRLDQATRVTQQQEERSDRASRYS
jgi:hypothetical protein